MNALKHQLSSETNLGCVLLFKSFIM